MATPYSFSCFPREPPKYPVINENPTAGAVIANFGAADVGRILGTTAVGAVWGFVWGAPLRPSNKAVAPVGADFSGVLWGPVRGARGAVSRAVWVRAALCACSSAHAQASGEGAQATRASRCCRGWPQRQALAMPGGAGGGGRAPTRLQTRSAATALTPRPACGRLADPATQLGLRGRLGRHDCQLCLLQVLDDATDRLLPQPEGMRARGHPSMSRRHRRGPVRGPRRGLYSRAPAPFMI